MNRKKILRVAEYVSPACTIAEISVEGMLCASVNHEAFDLNNTINYGSGEDNNGWI